MLFRKLRDQHRHMIRRTIGVALIAGPCISILFYLEICWTLIALLCLITASCFYCIDYIPLKGVASKFCSGFTYFTFFLLLHIIAFIFVFAYIYTQKGIVKSGIYVDFADRGGDASIPVVRDYFTCLYFSVVTFTTVGYGDFQPAEEARGVAALEAIVGFLFLGFFVGMVVYALHVINEEKVDNGLTKTRTSSRVAE